MAAWRSRQPDTFNATNNFPAPAVLQKYARLSGQQALVLTEEPALVTRRSASQLAILQHFQTYALPNMDTISDKNSVK